MNKLLLVCAGFLVLTNVGVLTGVMYNRSGTPVSVLTLTERELPMAPVYSSAGENSGTSLALKWQVPSDREDGRLGSNSYGSPAWLNEGKLEDLGFDPMSFRKKRELDPYRYEPRKEDVILVMEYNGAAYEADLSAARKRLSDLEARVKKKPDDSEGLKQLDRYKKFLTALQLSRSRLYVVDAGLDLGELQQAYSDSSHYLFARGEISISWDRGNIRSYIRRVYISDIHVPLPYSTQLADMTMGKPYHSYGAKPVGPRYSVDLNIGLRLEPWILSIAGQSN